MSPYRDSEPGPNAEVPHGSIIRDGLEQLLDLLRRRPGARTRKRRIDQSLERSRELGHFGRFVLMRHDRQFRGRRRGFVDNGGFGGSQSCGRVDGPHIPGVRDLGIRFGLRGRVWGIQEEQEVRSRVMVLIV